MKKTIVFLSLIYSSIGVADVAAPPALQFDPYIYKIENAKFATAMDKVSVTEKDGVLTIINRGEEPLYGLYESAEWLSNAIIDGEKYFPQKFLAGNECACSPIANEEVSEAVPLDEIDWNCSDDCHRGDPCTSPTPELSENKAVFGAWGSFAQDTYGYRDDWTKKPVLPKKSRITVHQKFYYEGKFNTLTYDAVIELNPRPVTEKVEDSEYADYKKCGEDCIYTYGFKDEKTEEDGRKENLSLKTQSGSYSVAAYIRPDVNLKELTKELQKTLKKVPKEHLTIYSVAQYLQDNIYGGAYFELKKLK